MQRVFDVSSVEINVLKSKKIGIVAIGHVPTGGWKDPQLAPWFYITPPADGIQDVDFYATEPQGIVTQVILPIAAELTVDCDVENYWGGSKPLLGIRVHATSNSMEGKIQANAAEQVKVAFFSDLSQERIPLRSPASLGGVTLDRPPVPWPWGRALALGDDWPEVPWPLGANDASALQFLVGRRCRVYKTGDQLTMDLIPSRVNIETDVHGTIARVWLG